MGFLFFHLYLFILLFLMSYIFFSEQSVLLLGGAAIQITVLLDFYLSRGGGVCV